jgi:hypothetical protein
MFPHRGPPGRWKKRFALLPMGSTYGPDKGREVWLHRYFARWRWFFGAQILDRVREIPDEQERKLRVRYSPVAGL